MKLSLRIRYLLLSAALVLSAAVIVFILTRPILVYVPADRVAVYQEVLGAWNGLPALNVTVQEIPNTAEASYPIREAFVDIGNPPAGSQSPKGQPATGTIAELLAKLPGRLPAGIGSVILSENVLPLSFDPLLVFKRTILPRVVSKKPEWLLAAKDDLLLGHVISWAAAPSISTQPGSGLAYLAGLASGKNKIQKFSFTFPVSDVVELFRSGAGQALILTLSQYRSLPVPLQLSTIPSSLPDLTNDGKKTQFSSTRMRGVVFGPGSDSRAALDLVQRLSTPAAQRTLAGGVNELAAMLDAPVRDAADYTARQMLITSRKIVSPVSDPRVLAAGRSVLASPAELSAVLKDFE